MFRPLFASSLVPISLNSGNKCERYKSTGLEKPLGIQDVAAPRVSRQSADDSGKAVSLMLQPLIPPGYNPVIHLCEWLSRP